MKARLYRGYTLITLPNGHVDVYKGFERLVRLRDYGYATAWVDTRVNREASKAS